MLSLISIAVFARSWWHLAVFLMIGGLANAASHPATHLLLARGVSAQRQGLAFGIKQSAIPAATLFAGLAVPLFGTTVGWRWAFVTGAIAALFIAWKIPPIGTNNEACPSANSGVRTRSRALLVLALAFGFGTAAAVSLGAFVVESAVVAGMRVETAGLLLALGSAIGLSVRVWLGWNADRSPGEPLLLVALMLGLGAAGFLLISSGAVLLVVLGTLLAFGAGWGWTGLFNFAVVKTNPGAPAAATGVTQTGAFTGAALGPLFFGILVERASYGTAWIASGVVALCASAAVLVGLKLLMNRRNNET
jgi:predicted MFS family arabinose efflux permease